MRYTALALTIALSCSLNAQEEQEKTLTDRDNTLIAMLKRDHKQQGIINNIVLRTTEKDFALQPVKGDSKDKIKASTFIPYAGLFAGGTKMVVSFYEPQAPVKTNEKQVEIYLSVNGEYVRNSFFLVKTNKKSRMREVRTEGGSSLYSSTISFMPHTSHVVKVNIEELENGIYKVVPEKPLVPGEYGIFTFTSQTSDGAVNLGTSFAMLYDFAITK